MSDENVYEASTFIIEELARVGVTGELWHTGGGCTAIQIQLTRHNPAGETAYIVITDGNSSVMMTDRGAQYFQGWTAYYYAGEDALMYGEPHDPVFGGDAWKRRPDVALDWRVDAVAMVRAIRNFVTNLER